MMKLNPGDEVFISSPLGALRPYRKAAASALDRIGLRAVLLENEWGHLGKRERTEKLIRKVRKRIQKCRAVISLLGPRSGMRIPGTGFTLTEHECMVAHEARLPIFAYVTTGSRFFVRLQAFDEKPIETLILSLCEVFDLAAKPEDVKSKVKRDFISRMEHDIANLQSLVIVPTPVEYWSTLVSNPDELRKCPPRHFEELVAELLCADGWEVELVVRANAPGPDIIAFSSNIIQGAPLKLIVECKKYVRKPVDVREVRNLVYWVNEEYRATLGMIATTSRFTTDAKRLVEEHHCWRISLKDQFDIIEWLGRYPRLAISS